MTTVMSVLSPGIGDARGELRAALAPVLAASQFVATLAGVNDPLGDFARELNDVLDSPLGDFVNTAWGDHQVVRAALRRTRTKPAEEIPLAHVQVTIVDKLRVEIDHLEKQKIEPTLTLVVDVQSLTVTVERGAITEIGPLEAAVTGQLELAKLVLFRAGRPVRVKLPPAHIDLREPTVSPQPATVTARLRTGAALRRS